MHPGMSPTTDPALLARQGLPLAHRPLLPLYQICLALGLALIGGCRGRGRIELPSRVLADREQLRIHHDFDLAQRHRLLAELTTLRGDVLHRLELAGSDEPIQVYLFEDEKRYRTFVSQRYPRAPLRRAFFTRSDTVLRVFAHWGEQVATDLRHETTHAYIHSVLPEVPLWLDEGLAEYFETPRAARGFQIDHVRLLARRRYEGTWLPSLQRLEQLDQSATMSQLDYAEAWLWTHFLLESEPGNHRLLVEQLRALEQDGQPRDFAQALAQVYPEPSAAVSHHLDRLIAALPPSTP